MEERYRQDAKYFIEMVGMASDCVGQVGLDGKYALIQVHPTYSLVVAPPIGAAYPTFEKMVFYTNCLAYEHDLPSLLWQVKGRAPVRPLEVRTHTHIHRSYVDSLCMAYEGLISVRLGPLSHVSFRWPAFSKEVDLPYTEKYAKVAKELSLYSTAVRQIDPLSEFLGYYRIVESVSKSNGKGWISANLPRLKKYNFGFVKFGTEFRRYGQRRKNLFSLYRRRALSRLNTLATNLKGGSIAEYLYNVNRCGIAHGKGRIRVYDFKYDVEEVSKDVNILKLLSRIAIEDKI